MRKFLRLGFIFILVFSLYSVVACDEKHECKFETLISSDAGHYYQCECENKTTLEAHTFGEWTVVLEATETEIGKKERVCSVCSYKEEEAIPTKEHNHSYGEYIGDATGHYQECGCGDKTVVEAHTFGEWEVVLNPTDTEEGKKERVCSACSYKEEEKIPANNHEHSYTYETLSEATCISAKVEKGTCSCGHSVERTVGEALGHTPLEAVKENEVSATCKVRYSYDSVVYCDVCDEELLREKVNGEYGEHAFSELVNGTPSTCKVNGTCDHYTCLACGSYFNSTKEKIDSIVLPTTSHEFTTNIVEATCTKNGSITSDCVYCDYIVVDVIPALTHAWNLDEATCTEAKVCQRCDEIGQVALGHDYQTLSQEATCTEAGFDSHTCSRCNDTYQDNDRPATGHTVLEWVYSWEEERENCIHVEHFEGTCISCNEYQEKTEDIVKHNYLVSISKTANCSNAGIKTYTCDKCGDSYDEEYEDKEAHKWDDGSKDGNIITYTCEYDANHTKEAIDYDSENGVSKDALTQVGEVKLDNASIAVDSQTLNQLGENVKLNADILDGDDYNNAFNSLTPEQQGQLGDNPIYNFGMNSNGETVSSFDGKVTVTVPYLLDEGEDPESIAIWFINENGVAEAIPASYANGYATFTTDHFSYYTVTRLTPEERCAIYGHLNLFATVPGTCTTDGYKIASCQRCGYVEKTITAPAPGHDLETEIVSATCTENGYERTYCKNETCNLCQEKILLATGHPYNQVEKVVATCTNSGYVKFICSICDDSYTITYAQKNHELTHVVTKATCLDRGYTTSSCSNCDYVKVDNYIDALGHKYTTTVVAATCLQDGYTLHTCQRCDDSYQTNPVKGQHEYDIDAPTCGLGQTCLVCGQAGLPATGNHTMVDGICSTCGYGCPHEFTSVVVDPTCTEAGYTVKTCSICGKEEICDETDALGHTGDFECSVCGYQILDGDFYQQLIDSLINSEGYNIHAEDMTINFGDEDNGVQTIKLNYLDLTVEIKGLDNITAYGTMDVEAIFNSGSQTIGVEFALINNRLYLDCSIGQDVILEELEKEESSFYVTAERGIIVIDLTQTEYQEICDTLDLLMESFGEDVIGILDNFMSVNSEKLYDAMANAFARLYTFEKSNDVYKLKINDQEIKDIVDALLDEKISAAFDNLFGEGSFAAIEKYVLSLFDKNIEEVIAELESVGIDLEKVFAFADKVVAMYSEGRYATLLEVLFPEEYKKYGVMIEFLLSDEVSSLKIVEFINKYFGLDLTEYKDDVQEVFDMLREYSLLDLILPHNATEEQKAETVNMIRDYIYEIVESLTFEIVTSVDGELLSSSLDATDLEVYFGGIGGNLNPVPVNGRIEFTNNQKVDLNKVNTIANKLDKYINIEIDDSIVNSFENATPIYDDYGDLIGIKTIENEHYFDEEYTGYTWLSEYHYTYEFKEKTNSRVSTSEICGNIVEIQYETYRYGYRYEYRCYVQNGEIIHKYLEDTYNINDYERYIYAYYDVVNKVFVSHGHEYELNEDESVIVDECGKHSILVYVCKHCNDSYTEYDFNYHNDLNTYELAEGSETCEDGVVCIKTCETCGRVREEDYLNYYHARNRYVIEINDENNVHEHKELHYEICPCGERFEIYFDGFYEYYDRENSDSNHIVYYCNRDKGCDLVINFDINKSLNGCACNSIYKVEVYHASTGEVVYAKEHNIISASHVYQGIVELDGYDYYDGGVIHYECLACGKTKDEEFYHHKVYFKEAVELADCGLPGEYVFVMACTCGDDDCYQLSEESKINYSRLMLNHSIVESYFDNGDGHGRLYKCTDEDCSLVFAIYNYYETLQEECLRVRYTAIFLGIDLENRTYQKQFVIHSYSETCHTWQSLEEAYVENGIQYNKNGEQCLYCECKDIRISGYTYINGNYCEVYWEEISIRDEQSYSRKIVRQFDDDGLIIQVVTEQTRNYKDGYYEYEKSTDSYVNGVLYTKVNERTYSNGETEKTTIFYEVINGENREISKYVENYDENSNVTSWESYTYEYSFDGPCYKHIKYTSSYGEYIEYDSNICNYQSTPQLVPGGTSCEDGWYYIYCCQVCGNIEEKHKEFHTYHEYFAIEEDFRIGCDHHISYHSCLCHREGNFNYNYFENVIEDGNTVIFSCEWCNVTMLLEKEIIWINSCEYEIKNTYKVMEDGNCVLEAITYDYGEEHTKASEYSLYGSSCEDGVYYREYCTTCGDNIYIDEFYDHRIINQLNPDMIDLSDCGSDCGGHIEIYNCACRENVKYHKNFECDMGLLNSVYYTDPSGKTYTAYIYRCSVTHDGEGYNPCNFTYVILEEYILREGHTCVYDIYHHYYLAVDIENKTYPEGLYFMEYIGIYENHLFKNDYYDSYELDGIRYSIWDYRCTVCGYGDYSEEQYKYYEKLSRELEIKDYYSSTDYGYTYWRQYVYEYSFAGPCMRTTKYSNSHGESWIDEENYCIYEREYIEYIDATCTTNGYRRWSETCLGCGNTRNGEEIIPAQCDYRWRYIDSKAPTCSQPGYDRYGYVCNDCGNYGEFDIYHINPYGHEYEMLEEEKYECVRCGLVNFKGVDGDVVFEEISYDSETGNIEIGFWNCSPYELAPTIVLVDSEGVEIEVIILDINMHDTTLEFNILDAYQAAIEAGYSLNDLRNETIAVRLAFVAQEVGKFDYGITFDYKG